MPTLAEQIAAGRTLKKVESVADRSAPAVHLDDAQAQWEADANENYYLDLGMEKWLPRFLGINNGNRRREPSEPLDLLTNAAQHRVRLTAQPALTCGLSPERVRTRS